MRQHSTTPGIVLIALAAMLTFGGCGSKPGKPKESAAPAAPPAASTPVKAAVYICPMDTNVVSDKPGTCPKCGMDLELKENSGGTGK